MTQNPILSVVTASTMLEELMLLTLQNYWETLSFRISNCLQV